MQERAQALADQFQTATRHDGTRYLIAPEDSDAHEIVRRVHLEVFDGILPNDWVYEATRDTLQLIAESDEFEPYDAANLIDYFSITAYQWAADHPAFRAFVNDAMARDRYTDIYDAIAAGQAAALIAIAETIVSHI